MVDKRMRNLIYTAIGVVCIVSILLGVFRVLSGDSSDTIIGDTGKDKVRENNTQVVLREEFSGLFIDKVSRLVEEDTMEILKQDQTMPLIVSDYEHQLAYSSVDDANIDKDKCEINVHFPLINLQGDYIAQVYMPAMQNEFYNVFVARWNKGYELSKKLAPTQTTEPTENQNIENTTKTAIETVTGKYIYEANFAGTVYQGRYLSIAVMSLDKIPGKSQRRYLRTFNVDIKTGEEITISKMLQLKGLEASKVTSKIKEEINKINESEKSYSNYSETYKRDKELAADGYYEVENAQNFMIGQNGELLIIYNYGNADNNYTTQFDVIKIEE